jgi:hypothetical protein
MSGNAAPQAQPLLPADQPQGADGEQAAGTPPPDQAAAPGAPRPSPLFSVPHPPSDAANWLGMVQAPFLPEAQAANNPASVPDNQKMARVKLAALPGLALPLDAHQRLGGGRHLADDTCAGQLSTGTPSVGSAAGRSSVTPVFASGTNFTASSSGDSAGRKSFCVVANALMALR